MKTVYVNTDTFDISMTEREGFTPFETDLFNYMSDSDIEAQYYVPRGYSWVNPVSGEKYTGEYICTRAGMMTNQDLALIRKTAATASTAAQSAQKACDQNTAMLEDIMDALVELSALVAEGG